MIVILERSSILWRCQKPYHHRWQTCQKRVSPYLCSTCHHISTLENNTCRQYSILSSLMSWRPIQVSPHLLATHLTNSEVRSFGFTRAFRCSRPSAFGSLTRCSYTKSSSASVLLWLLHQHLLVFFSSIAWRLLMELKWQILNKHKRWFRSSRVKFPSRRYVYELVRGVNLFDLDLGVQIDSIKKKKSRATLWVVETVRGLYIATRQYSSLCVSAVACTLGGDDIEHGVPDLEVVDFERDDSRTGRETGKRQTRRDNVSTLEHVTSFFSWKRDQVSQ